MTTFLSCIFPVHFEACANRPRLLLSVSLGNRGPPNEALSMGIWQLRVLPLGQAVLVDCRGPPMSDTCVDFMIIPVRKTRLRVFLSAHRH